MIVSCHVEDTIKLLLLLSCDEAASSSVTSILDEDPSSFEWMTLVLVVSAEDNIARPNPMTRAAVYCRAALILYHPETVKREGRMMKSLEERNTWINNRSQKTNENHHPPSLPRTITCINIIEHYPTAANATFSSLPVYRRSYVKHAPTAIVGTNLHDLNATFNGYGL